MTITAIQYCQNHEKKKAGYFITIEDSFRIYGICKKCLDFLKKVKSLYIKK